MHKDNQIKIPHTINYKQSLVLMEQSIDGFMSLLEQVQERDEALDGLKLDATEVQYHLNKWFFEHELPKSQIGELTLDTFREALAVAPETLPSMARYNELKDALNKELGHNKTLGLETSMYTAYAAITNYLSRRVEASGSKASDEVKFTRASEKLTYFNELVTV
jgi:hypothetical protein